MHEKAIVVATIEGELQIGDEARFASVANGLGSQTLTIGLNSAGRMIDPALAIGRIICLLGGLRKRSVVGDCGRNFDGLKPSATHG